MPSRQSFLVVRVAVLAIVGAIALAACSPAPSPLSDPREILDAAVTHLKAAKSVHVEASVDGTVILGPLLGGGPQASGAGLALTGTHLAGDLDLAAGRAAIRFQVPALLGLEGELRQVGADAYLESSLTSRGWHRLTGADLPIAVGQPSDWLTGLTTWLDRPTTVPVRLDDAACGSSSCYVVHVVAGTAEIEAAASGAPAVASALAGTTVTLDLRIDRASLEPAGAVVQVELATGGALTVTATFSNWDQAVSVTAPSESEIVPGPLFP